MALGNSAISVIDPTLPQPVTVVEFGFFGAIRQLHEGGAGDPLPTWLALPQEQITTRTFTFPTHNESTIDGLLQHSARAELPFPEHVRLRFGWSIIARTDTHSTVLLAVAKQETLKRLAEESYSPALYRIVPAFAPLYNLFITRYPATADKTYALLHLTPRISFVIICRERELLGVQNLSGFALRNGTATVTGEDEVASICGRLAPLLHRTLHSLETEHKMPRVDEIIISSSCRQPATLTSSLSAQLSLPIATWPDCGVPPTHLTALGLAMMARQPQRYNLFEFTGKPQANAKPVFSPLTALRYACHFLVVVLLFLSLQMILNERSRDIGLAAHQLNQELIALQPAIAASTTLYNENTALLEQVEHNRQSLSPDLAEALARLAEITPPDIAVRNIAIGSAVTTATSPANLPAAAPRRIASSDNGNHPIGEETTSTAPPVTITGRAGDAVAFVRYCQALEGARLLTDVRCRTAEMTNDGFSFSLEGRL